MASDTMTFSLSGHGTNSSVAYSVSTTVGARNDIIQEPVVHGSDGLHILWAADVSQIKTLWIVATKDMTLYTNADGGGGGQTLALTANVPKIYQAGLFSACPLTIDVTSIYLDNTPGAGTEADDGTLTILCGSDPTV
jgi:hypothetical protein